MEEENKQEEQGEKEKEETPQTLKINVSETVETEDGMS